MMRGNLIALEPMDIKKHAEGYFNVSQDENIHKYVGNTVPVSIDDIIKLLNSYDEYFVNWMIISNETQDVIGIIRLGKPVIENGLLVAGESQRLHSNYWRKGYMREAKKLFYEYVFNELSVDVLYADVWEGNINSIKSLESSGYKLIETQFDIFSKSGKSTAKYIYSFTKEDYLMRKSSEL
ncbi:GNAT family N-acetyltransferase [Alkaliphilus pronyensis]|uniref:GNAT family N-acetyltransferase n=1 Tax=Alkaliphilus pronyensis TaxID=1482732 RepID=A0A6I0FBF4_9FIRM|nr:GNAT family N-acetyltransferase [Alkaliphilus pronyensis]KAB3529429.1 GNAT family N-acetyltransferase [Alkaliphilus pronyensis]